MSFTEHVRVLQRELRGAGYAPIRDPVDISTIEKGDRITECEIIGRKDFFNVMYTEAESNWKGIASAVVGNSKDPCLAITRYGNAHHIFTTARDHGIRNSRLRHVVLETGSNPALMSKFIRAIKTDPVDDHLAVDGRVQKAFDKFSEYKQALDEFAENLDTIIRKTRAMIDEAISGNEKYEAKAKKMLKMCREIISDRMDMDDIKSMLIQHLLTYRIFALVYDLNDFHATNAVARSLEQLLTTLNLPSNGVSYKTMELAAESLTETDQKQDFLKKVYETFYKKYDPAKADKDGIVYTPSEAVQFMVRSTDELLQKHFGKLMSDDGITILDPAVGTGTFMVHVMRQIGHDRLEHKYKDLYANEISVLPYYIAALNIEHTYRELTGKSREFENICWIDTLDSGTKDYEKMGSWIWDDNVQRISRQQKSSIQVAIGNPPYNAVQTSLNHANPADKYDRLDRAIKSDYYDDTDVINKNKSFDMYKRFLKWSSDRIANNGMVVFISNNSFLDAKADKGVREALYKEFDHVYIVNLKGNARLAGDEWRREGGKLFGSQARVGICISFLVKTGNGRSDIQYAEIGDYKTQDEKLEWLGSNTISTLDLQEITPDKDSIWLNQIDNDFEDLVPILPKTCNESIFYTATLGVLVAKDDWAYDIDKNKLKTKMKYYISIYNSLLLKYRKLQKKPQKPIDWVDKKIKWSRTTLNGLQRQEQIEYSTNKIKPTLYRPFVTKYQYYDHIITEMPRRFRQLFSNSQNFLIGFPNPKTNVKFNALGTNLMVDLGCLDGSQNMPIWLYDNGKQISNVTQYGLDLFRQHYKSPQISAEEIFYYVYAIFNDLKYEETYRYNLRRDFPRIPLSTDFPTWSRIGRTLFDLHCNFGDVVKYDLTRVEKKTKTTKPILSFKKHKDDIKIIIDDRTRLDNIPLDVLEWKFKSKTPLEWILDFYKETKNQIGPSSSNDESVRKRFGTYRFEDHKEDVIALLMRVTTVCVETVKLRRELQGLEWGPQPKLNFTPIPKKSKNHSKGTSRTHKSNTLKFAYQKRLKQKQGTTQATFIT